MSSKRSGGRSAGALRLGIALLSGGRALGTRADRRRAAAMADRLYPGLLTVVGGRTLFPRTTGSEICFSVADDPDAVVRLRTDASTHAPDFALVEALTLGRAEADGLRALRSTFEDAGLPVVGLRTSLGDPWVAAQLTDDTVTAALERIGVSAREWARHRESFAPRGAGHLSLSVRVVNPAVAEHLPDAGPDLPTVMRLSHPELLAALGAHRHVVATYPVHDGIADTSAATVYLSRSREDAEIFGRKVRDAAAEWLRTAAPGAVVGTTANVWRLEPGRVDRITGHVRFTYDAAADAHGRRFDHVVAVVADPDGDRVSDFRIV